MPLIGDRLKEERERLSLSQPEIAEKCGVTMRSQRNYEKGERSPDGSYLAAAAAVGVDVLYVLTGQRAQPVRAAQALSREEEVLLDNYRNSPPSGQAAIKAASDALAKPQSKNLKKSA